MIYPQTISDLTHKIRSVIENEFRFVYLIGEISNYKNHSSGHLYFTLKDDKAQISANMWSSRAQGLFFTPMNGMKVIIKGRLSVYEARGTYQVDIFEMQPAGEGELQIAFEKLKQKLFEEGLFAEENKKPLPEYPGKVGIITSETGAALHDFINVTQKRYPVVKIFLFHATVQGAGSVESICSALKLANNPKLDLDIIVIARGGGSMEDLWSFNNEKLAREIFVSHVPVVSAVGHEIDFTISDFVSDLRAPTPSAAAEIIFPDRLEIIKILNKYSYGLKEIVYSRLKNLNLLLNHIENNYYFKKPLDIINRNKEKLNNIRIEMDKLIKSKLTNLKIHLDSNEKLLNNINPEKILKRGFTLILKDKVLVKRRNGIKLQDNVEIKFYDGEVNALIGDKIINT